jgi:hypothetical protein
VDSDHVLILISLVLPLNAKPSHGKEHALARRAIATGPTAKEANSEPEWQRRRFDVSSLRNGDAGEYIKLLDELSTNWLQSLELTAQDLADRGGAFTPKLVSARWNEKAPRHIL